MWLEIEVDIGGQHVRVSARGSRGERPPAHAFSLTSGIEALQNLGAKVVQKLKSIEDGFQFEVQLSQL